MAKIIKGSEVAGTIKQQIREKTEGLTGRRPCLCVMRIGDNAADISYEKSLRKNMSDVGIDVRSCVYANDISDEAFRCAFIEENNNDEVDGIMLFRPLPKHINAIWLENNIDPGKDVDCMSPINLAKLVSGDKSGYCPCTAEAVMKTLHHAGIEISGKNVVIVGRSLVVGKPLGLMMLSENATVTWCHTKTDNVPARCRDADIIVAAAGRAGLVTKEYLREARIGCAVIDVGINPKPDGSPGICGDVAFDEVENCCGYITTVPGGVGSVTNAVLAEHVLRAYHQSGR